MMMDAGSIPPQLRALEEWLSKHQVDTTGRDEHGNVENRPIEFVMPLPSITNPADLIRHPDAPSSVGTNAFEKLLLVMSYLCHSMQTIQMELERTALPLLSCIGQVATTPDNPVAADDVPPLLQHANVASVLPLLLRTHCMLTQLEALCSNILCQLGALSASQTRKNTILTAPHATSSTMTLGGALLTMLRVGVVAAHNTALMPTLRGFTQMLQEACEQLEHIRPGTLVDPPPWLDAAYTILTASSSSSSQQQQQQQQQQQYASTQHTAQQHNTAMHDTATQPSQPHQQTPSPHQPTAVPNTPRAAATVTSCMQELIGVMEDVMGMLKGPLGPFGVFVQQQLERMDVQQACCTQDYSNALAAVLRRLHHDTTTDTHNTHPDTRDQHHHLLLLVLLITHARLHPTTADKKLLRSFLQPSPTTAQDMVVISIYHHVSICPPLLLTQMLPPVLAAAVVPRGFATAVQQRQHTLVTQVGGGYAAALPGVRLAVTSWVAEMHALLEVGQVLGEHGGSDAQLSMLTRQIVRGVHLAGILKVFITNTLTLHVTTKHTMDYTALRTLGACVALLQGMRRVWLMHERRVAGVVGHLTHHVLVVVQSVLTTMQRTLESRTTTTATTTTTSFTALFTTTRTDSASGKTTISDVIALLQRMCVLAQSPPSRMQHVLLLQCCDSLDASGRCTAGDITTLRVLLHKLHTLTHLLPVGLARACALDGVLWGHVELLAALVQDAYMRHHEGVVEVPLMVEGWARDGGRVAAQRDVFGVGTEQGGAVQAWVTHIHTMLQSTLIQPLCHTVEDRLRLTALARMSDIETAADCNAHNGGGVEGDVMVMDDDGDDGGGGVRGHGCDDMMDEDVVHAVLALPALHIGGQTPVDVRWHVQQHLWHVMQRGVVETPDNATTYQCMRALAVMMYDLHVQPLPAAPHTPATSIAHVFQDIPTMVSSYSYCMTTSSLVQRLNSTPSPHLKTIQPHHLASLLHVGGVSGVAGVVGRLGDAVERLLEVLEEAMTDHHAHQLLQQAQHNQRQQEQRQNHHDGAPPYIPPTPPMSPTPGARAGRPPPHTNRAPSPPASVYAPPLPHRAPFTSAHTPQRQHKQHATTTTTTSTSHHDNQHDDSSNPIHTAQQLLKALSTVSAPHLASTTPGHTAQWTAYIHSTITELGTALGMLRTLRLAVLLHGAEGMPDWGVGAVQGGGEVGVAGAVWEHVHRGEQARTYDPHYLSTLTQRVACLPTIVSACNTPIPTSGATPPLALLPALLPGLLLHHVEGVLLAKERLRQPVITQPVPSEGGGMTGAVPTIGGGLSTAQQQQQWALLLPAPASSMQVVPIAPQPQQQWGAYTTTTTPTTPAEACIADEGLLMGVAFLLHVLRVPSSRFDTHAWFALVQKHYAAQRASMVEAARPGAAAHVGAHHAALAIARVERYAEEFVHVGQVLHAAQVLVDVGCATHEEDT